jgi:hypothetical protein
MPMCYTLLRNLSSYAKCLERVHKVGDIGAACRTRLVLEAPAATSEAPADSGVTPMDDGSAEDMLGPDLN